MTKQVLGPVSIARILLERGSQKDILSHLAKVDWHQEWRNLIPALGSWEVWRSKIEQWEGNSIQGILGGATRGLGSPVLLCLGTITWTQGVERARACNLKPYMVSPFCKVCEETLWKTPMLQSFAMSMVRRYFDPVPLSPFSLPSLDGYL